MLNIIRIVPYALINKDLYSKFNYYIQEINSYYEQEKSVFLSATGSEFSHFHKEYDEDDFDNTSSYYELKNAIRKFCKIAATNYEVYMLYSNNYN